MKNAAISIAIRMVNVSSVFSFISITYYIAMRRATTSLLYKFLSNIL